MDLLKWLLVLFVVKSGLSTKLFIRPENCGQRRNLFRETRIVGGGNAMYGEVPWMALIQVQLDGAVEQCGAVLVDQNWVLTAAHCVYSQSRGIRDIKVFLGKHCLKEFAGLDALRLVLAVNGRVDPKTNDWDNELVTRTALRVVINEEFDFKTLDNDIALIRLNQSVVFDHNIGPICLPKTNEDFCHQNGYISGFGIIDYGYLLPALMS